MDVCSLSCCPSNSGHPAPLLYRGGTNAHKAKRLLTHMQVDCTTQEKKVIPGRWLLNDGELENKGNCSRCSHNPILSIPFGSSHPDHCNGLLTGPSPHSSHKDPLKKSVRSRHLPKPSNSFILSKKSKVLTWPISPYDLPLDTTPTTFLTSALSSHLTSHTGLATPQVCGSPCVSGPLYMLTYCSGFSPSFHSSLHSDVTI